MWRIILLMGLVLLAGCRDKVTEPDPQETRLWGAAANGLRCSIELQSDVYASGKSIPVSIWIENITPAPIEMETIVAFQLYDSHDVWQYCAVFDLMANQPDSSRSRLTHLVVPKLHRIKRDLDLSQLGWTRSVDSRPPSQTFFALIGSGQFTLRLAIEIIPTKELAFNSNWIYSNDVPLQIN